MSPLDELRSRLAARPRITVLTGAGVSAGSGVPTFRGAGGLWRRHRAEELATPQAFARDPELSWQWYDWRRRLIAGCEPNAAHRLLAAWERDRPGFQLVTQNVDGLHERAGSERLIRFHGSIWELRCAAACPDSPTSWVDLRPELPELPVPCPHCDGLARPGVVWFGEPIDPQVLARADAALDCDLFLAIGTSALVYPAAGLIGEARSRGAYTVEINPEATAQSPGVDLALRMPAEEWGSDIGC